MTLLTSGEIRKLFSIFCVASGGMLVLLVYGFWGYMTSSARQSFCKSPPVGAQDCPLDYFMAAGNIVRTWLAGTAAITLPIFIAIALSIMAVRWFRARSLPHGDR